MTVTTPGARRVGSCSRAADGSGSARTPVGSERSAADNRDPTPTQYPPHHPAARSRSTPALAATPVTARDNAATTATPDAPASAPEATARTVGNPSPPTNSSQPAWNDLPTRQFVHRPTREFVRRHPRSRVPPRAQHASTRRAGQPARAQAPFDHIRFGPYHQHRRLHGAQEGPSRAPPKRSREGPGTHDVLTLSRHMTTQDSPGPRRRPHPGRRPLTRRSSIRVSSRTPTRSKTWKATSSAALARAVGGPRAVREPGHARNLHAREPGDPTARPPG